LEEDIGWSEDMGWSEDIGWSEDMGGMVVAEPETIAFATAVRVTPYSSSFPSRYSLVSSI